MQKLQEFLYYYVFYDIWELLAIIAEITWGVEKKISMLLKRVTYTGGS